MADPQSVRAAGERGAGTPWTNWAQTVRTGPVDVYAPRDTADVASAVALAARTGRKVKPIGSGHSFTAIGEPVDLQLQLHGLSGIVSHDAATGRVRVRAGTPLHVLNPALEALGLAMPNLGDIDRQTISGALSTGTHGTGLRFTGLSGFVTGVEMVLADGSIVRYDDGHRPDLVPAAAPGLGALGVITEYELQCVPAFLLRAHEAPSTLDRLLGALDETVDSADHFEFYWFPHTDRVLTKINTRLDDPALRDPLPRWREVLDDRILSNNLFEVVNRLTTAVPQAIPRINQLSSRVLSERTYTDSSYKIFATQRTVRFKESEFAVPRAEVPGLLAELKAYCDRKDEVVAFPVEVRFTAADDRWMSTAYGRETGYVAIHQYHRRDHTAYFDAFWSLLRSIPEARPHWGKMHDLDAGDLRKVYPKFDDFVALRDELDPNRVFENPYLAKVLG
ncbi:D-arabinono-1,4-lactone oxidase [Luteipulveratus mongoliensis]|uniref:FAD-linked oxidoreductase n=1 Tax=Luteipulveratus mongoliensis TaxID=571913 RepID=A0A0K1JMH7_9MICO|nr:D-arabinono-1,4-lactone oxidase [Luteipulveratus mongoliensis]AKU17919.1 FAD-linked oxidoreductase [Luteipulveratus mongoliensis]